MPKSTPINEEYIFGKEPLISSINIQNIITYVKRKFCEITSHSKKELIGHNYNLIRHLDTPKAIFKEWRDIVKNLAKDGYYYCVYSHISSVYSNINKATAYTVAQIPTSSETKSEKMVSIYNANAGKSIMIKTRG